MSTDIAGVGTCERMYMYVENTLFCTMYERKDRKLSLPQQFQPMCISMTQSIHFPFFSSKDTHSFQKKKSSFGFLPKINNLNFYEISEMKSFSIAILTITSCLCAMTNLSLASVHTREVCMNVEGYLTAEGVCVRVCM